MNHTRSITLVQAACVVASIASLASAQMPQFVPTDLGRLPGYSYGTYPMGLNNLGQVVGFGHSGSMYKAFLWTSGSGLVPLPPVPGHENDSSTAVAINDLGDIAGFSGQDNGVDYVGWILRNGQYTMLGSFPGFRGCKPVAINNAGVVVGMTTTVDFSYQRDSWAWSSSTGLTDPTPGVWGEVLALNDQGVGVGGVRAAPPLLGMLAWDVGTGQQTDLGSMPGGPICQNFGQCINASGEVVGVTGCRIVHRSPAGVLTDITPAMNYSSPVWLNDAGWLLGLHQTSCDNSGCRGTRAWLRSPEGAIALVDDLLVGSSHSAISTPRVINSRGQIIAMANGSGTDVSRRGVLLTPVAPSCVADMDNSTGTGVPDGAVTIDDLLYYLNAFEVGALRADLDDGSMTGTPDQGVTVDDLLFFLVRFEAGC
jgi:hypothetical protein